jgi:hypothetical protein
VDLQNHINQKIQQPENEIGEFIKSYQNKLKMIVVQTELETLEVQIESVVKLIKEWYKKKGFFEAKKLTVTDFNQEYSLSQEIERIDNEIQQKEAEKAKLLEKIK